MTIKNVVFLEVIVIAEPSISDADIVESVEEAMEQCCGFDAPQVTVVQKQKARVLGAFAKPKEEG